MLDDQFLIKCLQMWHVAGTTRIVFIVMLVLTVLVSSIKNYHDESSRLNLLATTRAMSVNDTNTSQTQPEISNFTTVAPSEATQMSNIFATFMQVSFFLQAVVPPVYVLLLSSIIVALLIYHTQNVSVTTGTVGTPMPSSNHHSNTQCTQSIALLGSTNCAERHKKQLHANNSSSHVQIAEENVAERRQTTNSGVNRASKVIIC